MRAILGILFIFTFFADFTIGCVDDLELLSSSNEISCMNGDIDHSSDKSSNEHEEEDRDCHCHFGHVHTTVFPNMTALELATLNHFDQVFPDLILNYSDSYLSKTIRPPIA